MGADMVIQVGILILAIASLIIIQYLPKKSLTKHRNHHRAAAQYRRHMSQATALLSRARLAAKRDQLLLLAKAAMNEAEDLIALDPKDPNPHLLKSQALDLMGHKNAALRSLDWALSGPRMRAISGRERAEALVRRAELKLAVNRRRRVDSAVSDLEEAIGIAAGGEGDLETKSYCLLGECFELRWEMKEEAIRAFQKALKLRPGCVAARQGLDRLGS